MNRIVLILFLVLLVSCETGTIVDNVEPPRPDLGSTKSLEIHVINVQQGDSTLIIGPNGTTLLIDGGDTGKGNADVVPYLKGLNLKGLDYMINTHHHEDHLGGLDEVINAGYDVRLGIWDNGGGNTGTQATTKFVAAAKGTTAGLKQGASGLKIPLGQVIDLGNGARATVVAIAGEILGTTTPFPVTSSTNENDLSVVLLIQYGSFDYIMSGDLGGGDFAEDRACTGRSTEQVNMESVLVNALTRAVKPLLTLSGVEAMMVPHHGSESSTNRDYMNGMSPSVAIISVGAGQGAAFEHPRKDIVEKVLMAEAGASCITAKPAVVLQTDEGSPVGAKTSDKGFVSGDIVIKTNGATNFQVSGSGRRRTGSPDERASAGMTPFKSFLMD